jgi:hypothetical protein
MISTNQARPKTVADLSCKNKRRASVFRWLDSYAGLNLIRFNGTHDQFLKKGIT